MNTNGISRRVDELGRIVIPKEFRKNLRIKSGDCLEIYATNGEIVLKKQDIVADSITLLNKTLGIISKTINNDILITDTDKFLVSFGSEKYETLINKEISEVLYSSLEERTKLTSLNSKIPEFENTNYIINPIIVNGDTIGSIILIGADELTPDQNIINVINNLFINHIEI